MDIRLKKRSDFDKVFKKGKRIYSKSLMIVYVPAKETKIGLSVSKKNGGAVVRNRIKRLLRAVFRGYMGNINGCYHIVAVPRIADDYSFAVFDRDVRYMLTKENLLNGSDDEK